MANHQAQWTAAKAAFFKGDATNADVTPDFVLTLNQGWDLGPTLKKFDAAKNFAERMKVMPDLTTAIGRYEESIAKALKGCTPKGKKVLQNLQTDLRIIWTEVQREAQPPRPNNKMVGYYTLRKYNLAAGVKTEFLKVDPTAVVVDVDVEVDEVFKKMLDSGELGTRAVAIAEVTTRGLDDLKARFRDTILKVDATIKANIAKDPKIGEKKTKEANEVLKYYKTLIEDDMKRKVAAEWDRFIGNRKELAEFKRNTAVKVTLGVIGVGVAAASVALSFGAAWPNIVAIVKGVSDIGKAIKSATENMDTTYERLVKNLGEIDKLNQQRRKAEDQGKGQKGSKAKQAAKEVVAGVLPITKLMLKTASGVKEDCKKFRGDVSKLETQADQLTGKLDKIIKELHGVPDKELTQAQRKVCAEMQKGVDDLIAQITDLTVKSTNAGAFAGRVEKAVKELEGHDEWTGTAASQAVGLGAKGAAVSGLANFITACANHGVTLIVMI